MCHRIWGPADLCCEEHLRGSERPLPRAKQGPIRARDEDPGRHCQPEDLGFWGYSLEVLREFWGWSPQMSPHVILRHPSRGQHRVAAKSCKVARFPPGLAVRPHHSTPSCNALSPSVLQPQFLLPCLPPAPLTSRHTANTALGSTHPAQATSSGSLSNTRPWPSAPPPPVLCPDRQ